MGGDRFRGVASVFQHAQVWQVCMLKDPRNFMCHVCVWAWQVWMLKDARNVVAVHCKGGKGRSGIMTSALILWSGHRKCALDALELFTFRRTVNYNASLGLDGNLQHYTIRTPANQTVEGPSQIRYVHYLEAVLYGGIDPLEMHKLLLTNIQLPVGELQAKRPLYLSVMVRCLRYPVFDSCNDNETPTVWILGGSCGDVCTFPVQTVVWGDVRIEIFRHTTCNKSSPRKLFAFSGTCSSSLVTPVLHDATLHRVMPLRSCLSGALCLSGSWRSSHNASALSSCATPNQLPVFK